MQRVRIVENIFEGRFAERSVDARTAGEAKKILSLESAMAYQDGKLLQDDDLLDESKIAILKIVPEGLTAAVVIGAAAVAALGIGIGIYNLLKSVPPIRQIQASPSLRGSSNSARKGERLPILLGRHRVYPDAAALPFSSYDGDNQHLHQLFCFGYNDVFIDESTLKIGETLLSSYDGWAAEQGLETIYPSRVVESSYSLQLKHGTPVVRSTASGSYKIEVGIIAPSGLYRYDKDQKKDVTVGLRIEWRVPGGSWQTAHDVSRTRNCDRYREMFPIIPSGCADGIYEVRISRTTAQGDSATHNDAVYLDVIKSFTRNLSTSSDKPVLDDSRYRLLALKLKATGQLSGVVGELNAVCTLVARSYNGEGTGPSSWIASQTRNPASAILYLLTSSDANPSPVADSLIDWEAFESFHQFCEDKGFTCDAWVTGEFTIRQLCEYIARSNMAELRVMCDRISVRLDQPQGGVVQMFTPRNAWGFRMERSFRQKPANAIVKYNDAEAGYVEVERVVSVLQDGSIAYDARQEGEDQQVDLFGVTSSRHAAIIGAFRMKELYGRSRTYSWNSDIEGIMCLPGDVVLIENDNFLLGLGEGRIKQVYSSGSMVTGILLDSRMRMDAGDSYGVRIRTKHRIIQSIKVVTNPGFRQRLDFEQPLDAEDIEIGDLAAFGRFEMETHKVLVTEITQDQHRSCSISAVDYAEDVYSEEDSIPEYESGISRYPDDGGAMGKGIMYQAPSSAYPLKQGDTGAPGPAGTSVTVSSIQYQIGASATTAPAGAWSDNPVDTTTALPYLWTKTTFSDGEIAYGVAKRGSPADWLELDVSNTALKQGQEAVIAASGSGDITTAITANGSTVPYAKVSKITPFHLGRQPIVLKNLSTGSSADWVQSSPGEYGLTISEAQNDWIADHRYYHRAVCKYTTTDQTPTWMAYYIRGGSLNVQRCESPSAGVEYTLSGVRQSVDFLDSRKQLIVCGDHTAISGVTTYGKQCLVIDLTAHPDLLFALALIGITSDDQIKAWLDEHIPWFPDEFTIGGSITNLMSPISSMSDNGCTVTPIPNGVRVVVTSRCQRRKDVVASLKSRIFHKIHSRCISGTHTGTVNIIDGGGYRWNYNRRGLPPFINLADYPGEQVASTYGIMNEGSTSAVLYDFWTPASFSSSDLIFDIWDSVAVDTYLSGLRAFMSLLGIPIVDNGSHESEWMHEYLSYFEGEGNLSSILPSSLLVTAVSTSGLTKHATISFVKDGEDGKAPFVDYATSDSNVNHPADGYLAFDADTYLAFNSTGLVYEIWQNNVMQQSGTYVWMRTLNPDGTYTYSCMSGQDARVFFISCDRMQVERNLRLPGAASYAFKMRIQGYNGASPVLTVNGTSKTISWNAKHDEGTFSMSIAYRTATAITAVFSDSANNLSQTLYLPILDTTGDALNLGVVEQLPANGVDPATGNHLVAGDWAVLASTNVLYVWNGSGWETKAVSSTTDFGYLEKVSKSLASMLQLGTTGKTTATLLGVFQMLCADEGFIKALKTWSLLVGQGNETSGFYVKIADEVVGSTHTYTFVVKFNGQDVFKIEPATGKVFIGSAFWYDPSDGCIKSTGDKTIIRSDGSLAVINGSFSGSIDATDGIFRGSLSINDVPFQPLASGSFGYNGSSLTKLSSKNVSNITRISTGAYRVTLSNPPLVKTTLAADGYRYIDVFALANSARTWDNGFNAPLLCLPNWLRNYVNGRLTVTGEYATLSYVDLYFINGSEQLRDPRLSSSYLQRRHCMNRRIAILLFTLTILVSCSDYNPLLGVSDHVLQKVPSIAEKYLGMTYEWGGQSFWDEENGSVDCSGFVINVYKEACMNSGVHLPYDDTTSSELYHKYTIKINSPLPGDLIFMGDDGIVSHVALFRRFIDDDIEFIDAYSVDGHVKVRRYSRDDDKIISFGRMKVVKSNE